MPAKHKTAVVPKQTTDDSIAVFNDNVRSLAGELKTRLLNQRILRTQDVIELTESNPVVFSELPDDKELINRTAGFFLASINHLATKKQGKLTDDNWFMAWRKLMVQAKTGTLPAYGELDWIKSIKLDKNGGDSVNLKEAPPKEREPDLMDEQKLIELFNALPEHKKPEFLTMAEDFAQKARTSIPSEIPAIVNRQLRLRESLQKNSHVECLRHEYESQDVDSSTEQCSELTIPDPVKDRGTYELWKDRVNKNEKPVEFLERVWGKYLNRYNNGCGDYLTQLALRGEHKTKTNPHPVIGLDSGLYYALYRQLKDDLANYLPSKSVALLNELSSSERAAFETIDVDKRKKFARLSSAHYRHYKKSLDKAEFEM